MSNYLTYKVKFKYDQYKHFEKIARQILNFSLDEKFKFEYKSLSRYYKRLNVNINTRAISLLIQRYNNTKIRKILKQWINDTYLNNGREFLKTLCYETFKIHLLARWEIEEEYIKPIYRCRSIEKLRMIIDGQHSEIFAFKKQFFKAYCKRNLIRSTAKVAHIWKSTDMPSVMVNSILRKYMTKTVKAVNHIKLKINKNVNEIKHDGKRLIIKAKGVNISVKWRCPRKYVSINSIEIDGNYIYISCNHTFQPEKTHVTNKIGVDLNTKGNIACAALTTANTGIYTTVKLGRNIHQVKSRLWRSKCINQRKGRHNSKEHQFMINIDHQISRYLVDWAKETKSILVLEDLTGIRNAPVRKSFKRYLCSWSFYRLREFIVYKAKMRGVPVRFIDPAYTSKTCSRCNVRGTRVAKTFKCGSCGHHAHADINAAFNIAKKYRL